MGSCHMYMYMYVCTVLYMYFQVLRVHVKLMYVC